MMNPKRAIMIGTMAFAITVGGGTAAGQASASALAQTGGGLPDSKSRATQQAVGLSGTDELLEALGSPSDAVLYESLRDGRTLADIAAAHNGDVRRVIRLQVAELAAQLDGRLAAGSLSPEACLAQKAELADMLTASAYGESYR